MRQEFDPSDHFLGVEDFVNQDERANNLVC